MKKTFKHAKSFIIIALLFAGVALLGAQEVVEGSEIDMDLDTLFGEEVVENVSDAPAATGDPVTAALKSDKVRIGGSFSGSLTPTATWTSLWDGSSDHSFDVVFPNKVGHEQPPIALQGLYRGHGPLLRSQRG